MNNKEKEIKNKEKFLKNNSLFFNKTKLAQAVTTAQIEFPHALLIRKTNNKLLTDDNFKDFMNIVFSNNILSRNDYKYLFANGRLKIFQHGKGYILPIKKQIKIEELISKFPPATKEFSEKKKITLKIEKSKDGPYQNGRNISIRFKKLPPSSSNKETFNDFGTVVCVNEKDRETEVIFSDIHWYLPLMSLVLPEKERSRWFNVSNSSAIICRFISSINCSKCSLKGHHHSKCPHGLKEKVNEYYKIFKLPGPSALQQINQKRFLSQNDLDTDKSPFEEENSFANLPQSNMTDNPQDNMTDEPCTPVSKPKINVSKPKEKNIPKKKKKNKKSSSTNNTLNNKNKEKEEANNSPQQENNFASPSTPIETSDTDFLPQNQDYYALEQFNSKQEIYEKEMEIYLNGEIKEVDDSLFENPLFKAAYYLRIDKYEDGDNVQKNISPSGNIFFSSLYEEDNNSPSLDNFEESDTLDYLTTHIISSCNSVAEKAADSESLWNFLKSTNNILFKKFVNNNK